MKNNRLAESIYWVGGIDWDLRNFHGYLTQKGSTYNSYLIMDDEPVIIDLVKPYLAQEMFHRIREYIDPAKIKKIIINHVEMDHSGALPAMMELVPHAEIICSPKGETGLKEHFGDKWNYRVVHDGETISLGKRTLQFFHTPMVHWPDNMVTYCAEEKILFSNDAFGQHLATSQRSDEEFPLDILIQEARKYFANIVLPYAQQVHKALEAVKNLDINLIAPSHGLIWKDNIETILSLYNQWSNNETIKKALIIYDTMWGSTKIIAQNIEEAFTSAGYATSLLNLQYNHISDIMTEVIDAEYIIVGSPTLNNNILPTVAAFLTYFKGLSPKGRKGFAFGSYGWGGQSIKIIQDILESAKLDLLESVSTKYIPGDSFLQEMRKKLENQLK
jgi:flavorubredoxin